MYDCDLARTITDAQRCGSVVEIRSRARRRNCGSYAYRATHWLASVVLVLTLADLPWSRGVARAQQVIYHEESLYNRKVDENTMRYDTPTTAEQPGPDMQNVAAQIAQTLDEEQQTTATTTTSAKTKRVDKVNDDPNAITAVLVDTGPAVKPKFEAVMDTFVKNLPKGTNFHIVYRIGMHGESRIHAYTNKQRKIQKDKKRPTSWTLDGLPAPLVNSRELFSLLMTNATWYETIPGGDMILIFHSDSIACSKPRRRMQEYLKYDLAAPPWPTRWGVGIAGNGGFSLRRKSKMIEYIKNYNFKLTPAQRSAHKPRHPEDVFFANSKTFKYPSRKDLEEFGVEHIYNAAPMGMHQPWLIMGQTYGSRRNALLKNCPELQLIWSPGQHRGGSSISRARETRESAINRAKQQASHVAFIRQRHKKMIINRAKYRNLPRKYQRIRG